MIRIRPTGAPALLTSRTLRAASAFTLALWLYEMAIWQFDADRHDLLSLVEKGRLFIFARSLMLSGLSFVFIVAFVSFSMRARPVLKVISFLLFVVSLGIEYAHHDAFDRFSTYSTAAVALYVGDWTISGKAFLMYFNPSCLPPIVVFLILLVTHRSRPPEWKVVLPFGAAMTAFAAFTAFFSSNRYLTLSPWAFARTAIGFPVIATVGRSDSQAFGNIPRRRSTIDYVASGRPTDNIVLIVDESVRGDYLDIDGKESTPVPILSELARKKQLANYGIATAGSTCSMAANNLLLTGLNDLPDRNLKIYEMPTIFQYARAMGYRTHEFDGQATRLWKGTVADLRFVQNRQNPAHLARMVSHPYEIDGEIARRVRRIVSTSTGNFVWVNKRGVHKPYSDNFPKADAPIKDGWKVPYDRRISTQQLIDDYRASIRYNLNLFFGNLFESGRPSRNTTYIYTSDHGQSLREGGVQVSHCSTSRPEAAVPLLILGSGLGTWRFDTGYRASHANIFPTLLDLMDVPPQARNYRYARSLTEARASHSRPRYYSDADLTGEDGGRRHAFDR